MPRHLQPWHTTHWLSSPPMADVRTQREEKHQPNLPPSPLSPSHGISFPPSSSYQHIAQFSPFPTAYTALVFPHLNLDLTLLLPISSSSSLSSSAFISCATPGPLVTELAADEREEFSPPFFCFYKLFTSSGSQRTGEINLSVVLHCSNTDPAASIWSCDAVSLQGQRRSAAKALQLYVSWLMMKAELYCLV